MKKTLIIILVVLLGVLFGLFVYSKGRSVLVFLDQIYTENVAAVEAVVTSPFLYTFAKDGTLHEVGDASLTSSPYWWLNSGGEFWLKDGLGKTVQGELPLTNKWRLLYSQNNLTDTDLGYHPQNIFRLLTRSKWHNFEQEAYFNITRDNFSTSPNRDASNGLLLFNRYCDSANLYYSGIRVDGHAVIKKKTGGTYFTMVEKTVFPGPSYNRLEKTSLLPKNTWIGLRSIVKTTSDKTVNIKLYMDNGKTGNWTLIAEANDNGTSYGGAVIDDRASGGIRTDFMDVMFDDYRMKEI